MWKGLIVKMGNIVLLDDLTINKIAAGEVIERPASVVKELMENSIDAGATNVTVEIKNGGITYIRITDNGKGILPDDMEIAFERHATSKIRSAKDLETVKSMGFRGEALASIAAIAHVELTSRTADSELGYKIVVEGGNIITKEVVGCPKGTTIIVENLFYNTPARLKHLKSLYTELACINEYINKLALSHPNIRFSLYNNDNNILKTDGSNNLLKTISSIYGIDVVKKMITVSASDDDYTINGFISLPEVHRSSRNHMITIVNGRVVRNTELNRIINDSYHSYKPDNRYPIVVLNITLDPSLVDVNIHPTKMDIKFGKFEELTNLVSKMIRNAIINKNLIPEVSLEEEYVPKVSIFDTVNPYKKKEESKELVTGVVEKPKYEEMTLNLERVKEDEDKYEKVVR